MCSPRAPPCISAAEILLGWLTMATVHRLPVRPQPGHDRESVLGHLLQLGKLELELGLVETRELVVSAVIAIAVAIPAAVLLLSSLVVLIAAAFAPLFHAHWQHLLIAGGSVMLLSLGAIGWSAWRLTHLSWPTETVTSFQENWQWLGAQLRSRLTLR
jgi:uncharacterized membrane protein YqjE